MQKGVFGVKQIYKWVEHESPQNSKKKKKKKRKRKKGHVCSNRIKKKAQQRLQIGNSFQTLADLEDDDMDISHDIQKPPIKTNITPILPPVD